MQQPLPTLCKHSPPQQFQIKQQEKGNTENEPSATYSPIVPLLCSPSHTLSLFLSERLAVFDVLPCDKSVQPRLPLHSELAFAHPPGSLAS